MTFKLAHALGFGKASDVEPPTVSRAYRFDDLAALRACYKMFLDEHEPGPAYSGHV